jgi:hypothetical protein
MAGRRLTAAQTRDRRSKRMAIGLGLLLLVVGVIQGPKLLKQLSPPGAPAAAPPVAPVDGGTSDAATGGTTGPVVTGTQLQSFSLLPNKDPFHALAGSDPSAPASTATSPAAGSPTKKPAAKTPATPAAKAAAQTPVTPAAKAAAKAASAASAGPTGAVGFTMSPPNAAVIRTNGQKQTVAIGGGFPSFQPLFKLVKLVGKNGVKGVRIGVVGGSFTSGVPTLLLRKGHKLTLANQADGSHFVIQLLSLTTAAATTSPASTTPATTPAATDTTTTTTTATTPLQTPATTTTTTPTATTPQPATPAGG